MPYGDTSALPVTAPWPQPQPRSWARRVLPLAFATVLSFAAGVGSTLFYLETTQGEFRVAEVPLVEADRAPTRVRPEGVSGSETSAVAAAPAAIPPAQASSGMPSPISSAMAMTPPIPAIDLPPQGIPAAPELVPPTGAQAIELPPPSSPPVVQPASVERETPPVVASGPETRLQVASFRTREKALDEMARFRSVHGALLSGMEFEIQRLDQGERGVFFRVISAPVGERADGVKLCAALAERRAQCSVVTLRPRATPEFRMALPPSEPAPSAPPPVQVAVQPAEIPPAVAAEPPRAEVRAQLATMRTLEGATRELNRLAKVYGDVLDQTELSVSRIDQGERGVFYRILTAPLPSRDAAGEFCQRLGAGFQAGCVLIPPSRPAA